MPHVLATAMGTLNQIAPGRITLGFGTGYTASFTIGAKPGRLKDMADHIGVCRSLLAGDEADMLVDGERHKVAFLHPGYGFLNTEDQVPIYVGASGPKGIKMSGDIGDGLVTFTAARAVSDEMGEWLASAHAAAAERGVEDFQVVMLTGVGVREPDEDVDSERLRGVVGPWVTVMLHGLAETLANFDDASLSPPIKEAVRQYASFDRRRDAPWIDLHRGHHLYVRPEEQALLNPELMQEVAIVGTAPELVDEIGRLEAAGVTEIYWQLHPGHEDELERFASAVMQPYRDLERAGGTHRTG
jgi:alkanesulfonate monooxygenase SsuD/methylene tetrahydromethanopterin reductase-like flavin-dependent oxidoreductase (luciferase family)